METAGFDKALADQIVTRLLGAGITIAEVSDRLNVPYVTLWRHLRNGGLTVRDLHGIAMVLGISVAELVDSVGEKIA